MLYLNHVNPRWWQLFTSLFCHASFQHLTGNLFLLLVFGRFVEEEARIVGVILSFLVSGACANVASLLLLSPGTALLPTISIGASGSVFALFTLSILIRFRLQISRLVETFILSTFVWSRVGDEFNSLAQQSANKNALLELAGRSVRVNHVAHVAGALAGVLIVLLLRLFVQLLECPATKKR